jgi:hypothetical protein
MIHVRYGIDKPTHDTNTEVPCAVVANQDALASNKMFNTIPGLLLAEVITSTAAGLLYDLLIAEYGTRFCSSEISDLALKACIFVVVSNLALGLLSSAF